MSKRASRKSDYGSRTVRRMGSKTATRKACQNQTAKAVRTGRPKSVQPPVPAAQVATESLPVDGLS